MEYDVFISCKSDDYEIAEEIYTFLKSRGIRAFLASESLRRIGNTAYLDEIDEALDSCKHLIVFATRGKYTESKFVKEEWQTFRNEVLSGRKNGNLLTVAGNGLTIDELPLGLRRYEVIPFDTYKSVIMDYLSDSSISTSNHIQDAQVEEYMKVLYGGGDGVEQNDAETFKLLKKSAEQGYSEAQLQLCYCYMYGNYGTIENPQEGLKWCRKAAEQGNAEAQFYLYHIYEDGEYVERNDSEAKKWLLKSALQNHSNAQLNLAECYLSGCNSCINKDVNFFFAGAKSLQTERDMFTNIISQLQTQHKGSFVSVYGYSYQNFEHKVIDGGHENEYCNFIRNSTDTIVFVLNEKIGEYTLQELDVALEAFKKKGHPQILVYAKECSKESDVFDAIRKRINEENQFWVDYNDDIHLRLLIEHDLSLRINKILEMIAKKRDDVVIG